MRNGEYEGKKMKENTKHFQTACRDYLSGLGINDLRTYGRGIGVARPTVKNKEELIAAIIGILCGELLPVPISRHGAPVKNDRVDTRIPAQINAFRREFFANDVMLEMPECDLSNPLKKPSFVFADGSEEKRSRATLERGQVHNINGVYYALPLDCGEGDKFLIPEAAVKERSLKEGDEIAFYCYRTQKNVLVADKIASVNYMRNPDDVAQTNFERCPSYSSTERIRFYDGEEYSSASLKFVDWLLPLTKGSRGCVLSAPKAGKTKLLAALAEAAHALNDKLEVYVLLIEQSPESIRDFQTRLPRERIFATDYEDDVEKQVLTADFVINRLKRRAEFGKHSLLIVDSLSALARAFNDAEASLGGKTLTCGLEIKTVRYMKKYFATARCLEGFGSVTVLGAVNEGTGNPFDDVVSAEFSSQANYELRLDDELAVRRIYPAFDFRKSRMKESELVFSEAEEEFDFLLRNELLSEIGEEEVLRILNQASSYQDFVEAIVKR